jgi:hypothetical protein
LGEVLIVPDHCVILRDLAHDRGSMLAWVGGHPAGIDPALDLRSTQKFFIDLTPSWITRGVTRGGRAVSPSAAHLAHQGG